MGYWDREELEQDHFAEREGARETGAFADGEDGWDEVDPGAGNDRDVEGAPRLAVRSVGTADGLGWVEIARDDA